MIPLLTLYIDNWENNYRERSGPFIFEIFNYKGFAFYAPDNIEWYQRESNRRKIGNLLAMMFYIEEKGAEFLGYEYPESFKRHTRYAGKRNVI